MPDQSTHWLQRIDGLLDQGISGAVLSFNTADRVMPPEGTPAALKYALAARYHGQGYAVAHFSLANGVTELIPPGSERSPSALLVSLRNVRDATQALAELGEHLARDEEPLFLILDYADHLFPSLGQAGAAGLTNELLAQVEMVHAWSHDDRIRRSRNFVVLVSYEDAVNELLVRESGFESLAIGLPDDATRQRFLEFLLDAAPLADTGMDTEGPDIAAITRASSGLRLSDLEDLHREARARGEGITAEALRCRKKQTIQELCGGLLEIIEPLEGFEDVAGCAHAKSYFNALKPLWRAGHPAIPQAVLLAGVPGSGKSYLIRAIAREYECPCLIMRGVREMWVGQSERNLDRILRVLDDLAPCLLWTDEIDQSLGGGRSEGGSGDSGTSDRLFGRLLEYFGDSRTRGRVLWLATTNRPDLLDVAMLDRFSIRIPFLHPTAQDRENLLPILAKQVNRALDDAVDTSGLAESEVLNLLSARALQEIVVWAGTLADLESGRAGAAVEERHLLAAIQDYKPSFDAREHEMIALVALRMTSFTSLLPWMSIDGSFDPQRAQWPNYLEGIVDPASGRLDVATLSRRLNGVRRYGEGD